MPIANELQQFVLNVGKASANALYPNEFEYYACALELIDSRGDLVDYFVFPVQPQSLGRSERKIKEIKTTLGGITVSKTSKFVPVDFQISGTMGRHLKILIGGSSLNFGSGLAMSTAAGVFGKKGLDGLTLKSAIFNSKLKTGYGSTKVLQAILDKSDSLDDYGKPMQLNFYNMAFGEAYVVEVLDTKFNTDDNQSNMMWRYAFNLKAVSPLNLKKLKSNVFTYSISSAAATTFTRAISGIWDDAFIRY